MTKKQALPAFSGKLHYECDRTPDKKHPNRKHHIFRDDTTAVEYIMYSREFEQWFKAAHNRQDFHSLSEWSFVQYGNNTGLKWLKLVDVLPVVVGTLQKQPTDPPLSVKDLTTVIEQAEHTLFDMAKKIKKLEEEKLELVKLRSVDLVTAIAQAKPAAVRAPSMNEAEQLADKKAQLSALQKTIEVMEKEAANAAEVRRKNAEFLAQNERERELDRMVQEAKQPVTVSDVNQLKYDITSSGFQARMAAKNALNAQALKDAMPPDPEAAVQDPLPPLQTEPVALDPVKEVVPAPKPIQNHFVICVDSSQSMQSIKSSSVVSAVNNILDQIKIEATKHKQESFITMFEFGGGVRKWIYDNQPAFNVPHINQYQYSPTGRDTPLFSCLGTAIETLEKQPVDSSKDVSYLVYLVSDGQDNSVIGKLNPTIVNQMIKDRQAKDNWTFALQIPTNYVKEFVRNFAVAEGNVQGWNTTSHGLEQAAQATKTGLGSYFTARSMGTRSVSNIYAVDMSNVSVEDLKKNLVDCSHEVIVAPVVLKFNETKLNIKQFAERATGKTYRQGSVLYQLTKTEEVQSYKKIMIRAKDNGRIFGGQSARNMIGLNTGGNAKIKPGNCGGFDIFVESTSMNRIMTPGTTALILRN